MKMSTKGRYGSRASLELAIRFGTGPVMVREIAAAQDISERYLEHILNSLRAAGLVKSTRGARGGYELARPPGMIKLGEIIRALEGPLDIVPCVRENGCPKISQCVLCEIWNEIKDALDSVIDRITLEEMADRYDKMRTSKEPDYFI